MYACVLPICISICISKSTEQDTEDICHIVN